MSTDYDAGRVALERKANKSLACCALWVAYSLRSVCNDVDPLRSAASLKALDAALKASKDEELKGFVQYLSKPKNEVALIVPGGPLIPKPVR